MTPKPRSQSDPSRYYYDSVFRLRIVSTILLQLESKTVSFIHVQGKLALVGRSQETLSGAVH